ncbi:MAG: M48 family metallopeptidase [Bryobacteraceae bacterium]|nr:M48 family metallopeptidase [Bryobacteraceae bacterium]
MVPHWQGAYFDGQTAARHEVQISFGAAGLELLREDGSTVVWPYWSFRASFEQGRTRLETKTAIAEILTIADPAFAAELRAKMPALAAPASNSHTLWKLAGAAAVALVVLSAVLWISLPYLGRAVASLVPRSWEDKLGELVIRSLAPESKRCKDPAIQKTMEQILRELERVTPSEYKLRLYVVDDRMVNAFAAPGGHIVLYRGLIEKSRSPEEVAGVLAHEMQHVLQRHGTKAMMRGLGIRILLAALIGDAGALAELTGTLGELHFLRQDEDSADREGMKSMQRARLDPFGMVDLLRTLEKEAADMPDAIKYLSTHPQTRDRIAGMERLAKQADYRPKALLPGLAWPPPMNACGR